MTAGRRREKGLPHAMPFHSTETEEEAEALIVLHCRLGIVGGKRRYVVRRDWEDDDILEAMRSAARQFGLLPND